MKWRSELSSLCPTPSALITFSSLPAGPPVAVSKLEGSLWATVPISEEGRGRLPEVGGMRRAWMGSYLGPTWAHTSHLHLDSREGLGPGARTFLRSPLWAVLCIELGPAHPCHNIPVTWASPPQLRGVS